MILKVFENILEHQKFNEQGSLVDNTLKLSADICFWAFGFFQGNLFLQRQLEEPSSGKS